MSTAPEMRPVARIPGRVADAYRAHVQPHHRRRAALRLWLSFLLSFVILRAITWSIRNHVGPFHDVVAAGGLHIHHYIWGITLLILAGILLVSLDAPRWHPHVAVFVGIGAALVIDEFALLLNLKDVYWQDEGRVSIDVGVVVAALLGLYYAANCFWNAAAREIHAGLRLAVSGEQRLLRRAHRRGAPAGSGAPLEDVPAGR